MTTTEKLKMVEDYLSSHESDSWTLAVHASLLQSNGGRSRALAQGRKALAADPANALAHFVMSRCLGRFRPRLALEHVNGAIELDSDMIAYKRQKLSLLVRLSGFPFGRPRAVEALRVAKQVLRSDPSSISCPIIMAWCYGRPGKIEKGINMYNRALSLDPTSESTLRSYARFLYFHWKLGSARKYRGMAKRAKLAVEGPRRPWESEP